MCDGGSGDDGGTVGRAGAGTGRTGQENEDGAGGENVARPEASAPAGDAAGAGPDGWFARVKRHRLLACGTAVVVLAAAVAVPLLTGGDGSCWQPPAATRALADDPAAATKALDPGDDLGRISAVERLLVHDHVCGDGARVLGRLVESATRAASPGAPHTMAQARSAYAVAALFRRLDPPAELARAIARVLADYEVDTVRDFELTPDESAGPATSLEEQATVEADKDRGAWLGRFLVPNEAHTFFGYDDRWTGRSVYLESLVGGLVADPQAFAVLYDADRAYFAHYLERLTGEGDTSDMPGAKADDPVDWATHDLRDIASCFGELLGFRTRMAQDGTIGDLEAFDDSVRAHTRGTYRPAAHQVTTLSPMGSIAARRASGPLKGDLADGRHQLFTVLDTWAAQRHIPAQRLKTIRQSIDNGYVRGLWYGVST